MNVPAPATIRIWGTYDPDARVGTINARFINSESEEPLNGNILFIITEDSIFFTGANLDPLHNHVARDYIPNYIGSSVSIALRDSVTVSYPFNISSAWEHRRCEIVTMIQDPVLSGDSLVEIWQGAKIKVSQLTYVGVEEQNQQTYFSRKVEVAPNPCVNETRFAFNLPKGTGYKIGIFDVSGRQVKTVNGTAAGERESVRCDLKTTNSINSGIYFYRFSSNVVNTAGKIIIQ